MKHGGATRWVTMVAALAITTGVMVSGQLVGAAPAAAVSGLEQIPGPLSPVNSSSPKTAPRAYCPSGKRVIGGGGWVHDADNSSPVVASRLTLTQLQPVHPTGGGRDYYEVTGAETAPGTFHDWWVQAYAICANANALPGLHIEPGSTIASSRPVQATAERCPGGERVLGTGARISTASGQVVLQVARASGSGDIARAQAHEDANGYAGTWNVTAYAVCAPQPPGYQVVGGKSTGDPTRSTKVANANCPLGKRVHGAGAAIGNDAPGNVALQVVYPNIALKQVTALAAEVIPTENWDDLDDYIVAQAICAF